VRTAEPLSWSVYAGAPFDALSCLISDLGADVSRGKTSSTVLNLASFVGQHNKVRYLGQTFMPVHLSMPFPA
jgi:hypothetical protein